MGSSDHVGILAVLYGSPSIESCMDKIRYKYRMRCWPSRLAFQVTA
jgi:hypothetical protein